MKLLATLSACLFSGMIAAAPLHNIVVFGDSLSDNGNLYEFMKRQFPQSPPYYQGRFSNGPVWIEYLANSYFPKNTKARLFDYAYGGAGVSEDGDDEVLFTLRREIQSYLIAHQDKADPNDLYVVWIGANNYLATPPDADENLNNVNIGITHGLQSLAEKGAKHILILNLPDLSQVPAAAAFDSAELMGYYALHHNENLEKMIAQLKQTYPQIEWLFFDMGREFSYVMQHPADFGFTNTTGTCSNALVNDLTKKSVLRMVASVTPNANKDACDGYVFFDLVHPTSMAHQIIAKKAREMLDAAGVVFTQ